MTFDEWLYGNEKVKRPNESHNPKFEAPKASFEQMLENEEIRQVDNEYINTFIADANSFFDVVNKQQQGLGSEDAASHFTNFWSSYRDLRSRKNTIQKWLEVNKGGLDKATYSSIFSNLESFQNGFESVKGFYDQFEDGDSYSSWYKNYRAEQDIMGAEDFAEYSQIGANIKNPDKIEDVADTGLKIFGHRIFGEEGEDLGNVVTMSRSNADYIAMMEANGGTTAEYGLQSKYRYMTDNEVSIYNYYLGKGDKDKAAEYLASLDDILDQRWAGKVVENFDGKELLSMVFAAGAGIEQFAYGVRNIDNLIKGTEAESLSYTQYAAPGVRENLDGGWGVGYDLISTSTNMLPTILASTAVGIINPVAGTAVGNTLMQASVTGNAYAEMRRLGYDENQSRAYGVLVGAAEAGLQYALGGIGKLGGKVSGKAIGNLVSKIDNALARTAIKLGGSMASEGLEEAIQTVLEPAFKALTTGETFEAPEWDEVLYSALLGALSAGVFEGVPTIAGEINVRSQGANLKGSGVENVDKLVGLGKTFADGTTANRLANKVNKDSSSYTVGRLLEEVGGSLSERNIADVASELQAKGMSSQEAMKTAQWLYKAAEGGRYSKKQQKAYMEDERISDVHRDLFTNEEHSVNKRNAEFEALYNLAQDKSQAKNKVTGKDAPKSEVDVDNATTEATQTAPSPSPVQAEGTPVTKNAPVKEIATEGEIEASADAKTTIEIDGEDVEVNVEKIESINDGKISVKLDNGETVDASEVNFGGQMSLVYEAARDMSTRVGGFNVDTANVFVRGYDAESGLTAAEYVHGWSSAYKFGAQNTPMSILSTNATTSQLTEKQRETAYRFGKTFGNEKVSTNNTVTKSEKVEGAKAKTDSKKKKGRVIFDGERYGKTLNKRQRASIKALNFLAEALGKDIYVEEITTGENGWYDPTDRSIHVDLNAGALKEALLLFTTSHELSHDIRATLPEKFNVLADAVFEEYTKKFGDHVMEDLIKKKIDSLKEHNRIPENMTEEQIYDYAYEEVICDCLETMLVDSNAIEALSENIYAKDKGLWQKIKDFFAKLVARIKAAYADVTPDSEEGQRFRALGEGAERIKKLWVEAIVELSEVEMFSTDNIRGSADGAVVSNEVTDALVDLASKEGKRFSIRTEYKAMPKQVMNLSTGEGTILHTIEGIEPTRIAGLSTKGINGYSGRVIRDYAMRSGGFNKTQIGEVNKFMDAMSDFMKEAGVTYRFIGLQDVENAQLHYSYNPDGSIKSIVLSAMVKNGDYPVNFDLSSICKKRVAMSALIDKLAKRGSLDNGTVKLTPSNIFKINTALKDAGYETACLGCFVESKRYNSLEWATTFCNKWNAAVKKVNPNATYFGYGNATFDESSFTIEQAIKIDEAANKYIKTTKTERLGNALAKYKAKEEAGLPLIEGKPLKVDGEELNTFSKAARKRLETSDTISDELKTKYLTCDVSTLNLADVEFLLENGILPGAALSNKQAVTELVKSGEAYQHLLRPSDLLTDRGISKLEALPNFHGVLYGHYGSGTPKLMQSYTPYNSEIALLPSSKGDQSLAEYLYTIAGVRMQSFSDFQIQNIYDYLQMVADLAARKVPAHAYTKEISFAKLLGMTGIKVNLSVMFDIDPMVDKAHAGLTKLNPLIHKGEYAKVILEDAQGRWVYNIGDYQTQKLFAEAFPNEAKRFLQSIGFADAVKLQTSTGYSANCGIIGVGYSDLGIFAMLDDNRIRYIIPYHASSLPAEIKVATHIDLGTDYTPYQNNMKIAGIVDRNGNKVNWTIKEAYKRLGSGQAVINELNDKVRNEGWVVTTKKAQTGHGTYKLYEDLKQTNDPRQTANNFMDWCIGNSTLPLFYQFASHNNYYKLLYDYNVYDCVTEEYAPQQAVTNTYPTEIDGKVQAGNVIDGGFNVEYFQKTIDKQMAFMNEYSKNLDEDLGKLAENMEEGNYSLQNRLALKDGKYSINGGLIFSDRASKKATLSERDSNGNALSKEQQEFFKDSKVRDENGNLRVVYHGTPSKFTTFRQGVAEGWGKGIYFTDNIAEAKNFGDNIVKAYLNITNPFDADTMNYDKIGAENTKAYRDFDIKKWQEWYSFDYDTYEEYRDDGMGVDMYEIYTEEKEVFNKILRELGYDGIIATGSNSIDGLEIVAFNESQPKLTTNKTPTSNPDIRYSDRASKKATYAPTFYSHMGKVIDDIKLEKMGTSSILNHLKNRGVKNEELKWSGIEAFLEGKKSVTKAELQEFVAGSQLQIKEEVSEDEQNADIELVPKAGGNELLLYIDGQLEDTLTRNEYGQLVSQEMGDIFFDEQDLLDQVRGDYAQNVANTNWSQYKLDGGTNYRELVFKMPNSSYSNSAMRNHWGQDAEGVLAHARIQDFEIDGKKMLFIEEIQSDWHNEGAKSGYEGEDVTKYYEADRDKHIEKQMDRDLGEGQYALLKDSPDLMTKNELDFINGYADTLRKDWEFKHSLKEYEDRRVPHAPFRDNYHEYVLKRLLRMAAEEGYDSIGWTPAEIQDERWADNQAHEEGKGKSGNLIGYTIEYDQDIPKFLRKYGKKWGAEVGKTAINGDTVWSMSIPDSMTESVLYEGQVMYQDRPTDSMKPRTLLANALETTVTEEERNLLQTYKDNLDMLNSEQEKLDKVMGEIDKIRYKKSLTISGEEMSVKTFEGRARAKAKKNGIDPKDVQFKLDRSNKKYIAYAVGHGTILEADKTFRSAEDSAKLKALWSEAKDISDQISTFDRELLKLQAMEPIKNVLQRERAEAYKRATKKAEERRKESIAKVKERTAKTEEKLKLQRLILQTSKWISYPSKDDVKCPDILRVPYATFLENIDLSSKRLLKGGTPTHNDERVANAMNNLANAIERIKNSQDPSVDTDKVLDSGYLDLPVEFVSKLREMAENISKMMVNGDFVINQMSSQDIKQLTKLIRTLNKSIKEMSTLYATLRFANVETLGDNSMSFLESMGEAKKENGVTDFVAWDNVLPYYAFKRFGEGGEAIFEALMDGMDKLANLADDIFAFRDKTWTDKESKAWSEDTHTIDLPSGGALTLTTANAMGIYCLSRREQGRQHLLGGGTRVIGIKKGTKKMPDSRSTLTQEDIDAIVNSLTDRQKQVALEIQKFMSTTCAEWGNEISMKRFLTNEFTDPNYYPIESNDENLSAKDPQAQQSDLYRLLNISATKPLAPGANNEVIIRNIFDVFIEHSSDMAKLNAFGLPLLDYMKWANYREKTVNEAGQVKVRGVHKSMTTAYGDKAWSYVLNLIKDVNGRHNDNGDNPFLMGMMRMQKTASVGNNLRVAFLQFTSYPRASLVLSNKSLALGLTKKPQIEKAKKYCGIALWKSFGFYDTNIARSIEDQLKGTTNIRQKLIELSMKGPEWADAITWGALWNACEYEVAKTTKNEVGSEEFYKEVGLKLREVVYSTQVVDSILTRSQIMRSKSGLTQMATAYMSEPTLTTNILMDAGFQFQKEARMTGSKKVAWEKTRKIVVGAIGNYLILQLLTSLAESLADAWRDDDEEKFLKKFGDALLENFITNLIPFNKVPIISDIADLLLSFFDIGFVSSDNLATSWITQTADAVKTWCEILAEPFGGKETSKTVYKAIYQTAKALSAVSGISVSGAMREVVTLWNNTAGAIDPDLKVRQDEVTNTELGKELYKAIVSGNDRRVKRLESTFDDKDAVESAIKQGLRDNDPRIKKAAKALESGDIEEYIDILDDIVSERHFDEDVVVSAIRAEQSAFNTKIKNAAEAKNNGDDNEYKRIVKELRKAYKGIYSQDDIVDLIKEAQENTSEEEEDNGTSVFKTEDYYKAVINGSTSAASTVFEALVEEKLAEGYLREEAERMIASSFATEVKKAYMEGDLTRNETTSLLISHGGKDSAEAETEVKKYDFELDHGISWSERARAYRLGKISESALISAIMDVEGSSREEAEGYVRFLDLEKSNPTIDISASDATSYFKYAEPAGISVDVFMDYKSQTSGIESDKDINGNSISGSRKKKIMQIINSLPISSSQKDALYYTEGWAASKLYEAPWH